MFLLLLNYIEPLDKVDLYVEAHREFLDKHYGLGHFICSGRRIPRTGGVILCKAGSLDEVQAIIKEDPFLQNSVTEYEVIEFEPSKYADGFERFI